MKVIIYCHLTLALRAYNMSTMSTNSRLRKLDVSPGSTQDGRAVQKLAWRPVSL